MSNNFLHKEYELCFDQLRFYDERQANLLKFLFSLTSSVAAAQFALYKLFNAPTKEFFVCLAFLSFIVATGSLLVFLSMLQNRLYFVFTARQINALRGHLLANEASEFSENQLYTRTDFSAVKPFSVHTYKIIGSAFIISLFNGSSIYSLSNIFSPCNCLCLAITASIASFVILSFYGYLYLKNQGDKSADQAIHQAIKLANKSQ